MNWIVSIYTALLFFILTPGILLRLPPKGKLITVAIVHAIVFALVFHFTNHFVWKLSSSYNIEGARNLNHCKKNRTDVINNHKSFKKNINDLNSAKLYINALQEFLKCHNLPNEYKF
jgi:hypothetical protein